MRRFCHGPGEAAADRARSASIPGPGRGATPSARWSLAGAAYTRRRGPAPSGRCPTGSPAPNAGPRNARSFLTKEASHAGSGNGVVTRTDDVPEGRVLAPDDGPHPQGGAGTPAAQRARVELATPAVIDGHIQRIEAAFATLREEVRAFRPDVLVVIGDDQGDMFDAANNPTFAIYTGDEPLWGLSARDPLGTPPHETHEAHLSPARRAGSPPPARSWSSGDSTWPTSAKFDPRGNPTRGVSHMVLQPGAQGRSRLCRSRWSACSSTRHADPPLPSAARCAQLAPAIGNSLQERPERVAIYASGGLSHYPGMFNAGWIDGNLSTGGVNPRAARAKRSRRPPAPLHLRLGPYALGDGGRCGPGSAWRRR